MLATARPSNLLDIDSLVETFLQEYANGIATVHRIYFHTSDELSLRALKAELMDELRTGCVTYLNKDYPMDEINSYLFYIVNDYCKKRAVPQVKKKTEYLCPGCLFLGRQNIITITNQVFRCHECTAELKETTDPKKMHFYRTFFRHNKSGYHCDGCERFIPHPLDETPVVSCPYFDCYFVGSWDALKRMHHPSMQSNPEKLVLDSTPESGASFKDALVSPETDALTQLEVEEELEKQAKILHEVIDAQKGSVPYSSSDFTIKHKVLCYQAFDNLLKVYPEQMVEYLLHESRSGGFQHKVFQEYIRLLEESLPFNFKKGKRHFRVESLLDENLKLFDGISTFDAIVNERQVVKNGTQEFYIGGRKGRISQPYYIGKLLNVFDKKAKVSVMDHVRDYTFSLIRLQGVEPGTQVTVTHLRVPPHYQMGGMVYVNRVRKKIVERTHHLLEKGDE